MRALSYEVFFLRFLVISVERERCSRCSAAVYAEDMERRVDAQRGNTSRSGPFGCKMGQPQSVLHLCSVGVVRRGGRGREGVGFWVVQEWAKETYYGGEMLETVSGKYTVHDESVIGAGEEMQKRAIPPFSMRGWSVSARLAGPRELRVVVCLSSSGSSTSSRLVSSVGGFLFSRWRSEPSVE